MKKSYLRLFFFTFIGAWLLVGCDKIPVAAPAAPPVVLVVEATQEEMPIFGEAIALLDGSTTTQVHAQVSGYLIKQVYKDGTQVKQGDLLFQIDPKPFQAELDKAQTNLDNTRITAPVTGIAGRAIAQPGDWVNPGMALTVLSASDPIKAGFALPRPFYLKNADGLAKIMAEPIEKRPESLELLLADGTPYPKKGRFDSIDHQNPSSTGPVTVYALFPNPDRILRPGQYAKIHGMAQKIAGVVVIPQRAVSELQGIAQVVVIKPDNTAEIRNVTLGERVGSLWSIPSGLQPGERVVVEGLQNCQPGASVTPQPYVSDTSQSTNAAPAAPSGP